MRDLRAEDPAETVLAWEAVEELLGAVPDAARETPFTPGARSSATPP